MSKPKYAPCPFCGTPDPEVTTQYRDHYDIQNARKDVLEMRLVSCTHCFAGALEEMWLQLPPCAGPRRCQDQGCPCHYAPSDGEPTPE